MRKLILVALIGAFASGCMIVKKDTGAKVKDAAVKACASGAELETAWLIGKEGGIFTDQKLIAKVDAAFVAFKLSCDSTQDLENGLSITQLALLYVRLKPVFKELINEEKKDAGKAS